LRWRPAGMDVHDHAPVRVTAHASGGRLSAAFGGHLKSKSRAVPPAGLCNGGRGGVRRFGGGRCLWSRLSRIPRRCRRLTEAGRSGGIKPHHCCWPAETPGLTPPARPAWLRPPTATRDPGQHPCGVNRVHFATHTRRQDTHIGWRRDTLKVRGSFPQAGLSRIPRRCRRCLHNQPGWPVSSRTKPDHSSV